MANRNGGGATAQPVGTYDYVIVGAGSAGCVLANRLTRDPAIRVLLLEAGGEDRYFWIHVPVGMKYVLNNPNHDWCFQSEPEPYADHRRTSVPRGKGLGGSSSINAMCYLRGHRSDYDGWRALGNPGWSWAEVLPHFKAIEDHPQGGSHDAHGRGGEMSVCNVKTPWPILKSWYRAAVEAGIPETEDFNRGDNEGVSCVHATIKDGRRWSAAQAFLHPVRSRPNLQVITDAQATRLLLEGRRARGVEFRRGEQLHSAQARIEVIVSAGAIGSPQLLQVSGIGPGALLAGHGIATVLDAPGVGDNMQDHWQLRTTFEVRGTVTMNQWVTNPLRRYAMGAYYLATRKGPMSMQPPQLCAFTRSDPSQPIPNVQYHVSPYSSEKVGGALDPTPGFSSLIALLHPHSIGHCRIRSADVRDAPAILHNYLQTEEAHRVAIDTIRLTRRIVGQKALAAFQPREKAPGPSVVTDDEILAYARASVMTAYHQCGTCKMGPDGDPMAVVDARLRVRGIEGLRVVDASIMPTVPSGNTNAPTMMIAEKAAAMIVEDRKAVRVAQLQPA